MTEGSLNPGSARKFIVNHAVVALARLLPNELPCVPIFGMYSDLNANLAEGEEVQRGALDPFQPAQLLPADG